MQLSTLENELESSLSGREKIDSRYNQLCQKFQTQESVLQKSQDYSHSIEIRLQQLQEENAILQRSMKIKSEELMIQKNEYWQLQEQSDQKLQSYSQQWEQERLFCEQEKEKLRVQIDVWEKQYQSLEELKNSLEEKISEEIRQSKQIEKALESKLEIISELQNQNNQLQAEINQMQQNETELLNQSEQQNKRLQTLQQIQENQELQLEEKINHELQLRKTIENIELEKNKISFQLRELTKNTKENELLFEEGERDFFRAEKSIKELIRINEAKEFEIHQNQNQLKELSEELFVEKQKCEEMQKIIGIAEEKIRKTKDRGKNIETNFAKQWDEVNKQLIEKEQQLKLLRDENAQLLKAKKLLNQERLKLKQELIAEKSECHEPDAMKFELRKLKAQYESLFMQNKALKEENSELKKILPNSYNTGHSALIPTKNNYYTAQTKKPDQNKSNKNALQQHSMLSKYQQNMNNNLQVDLNQQFTFQKTPKSCLAEYQLI